MKFFKYSVLFLLMLSSALFSQQVTGLSGWNIFLDPGHSQNENVGIYNISEAKRNLRVALRLSELLLENTDIDTVYLSRTNDQQQVSLSQRTDRANSLAAAWYHSIHSNAGSPDRDETLLLWGQYYNGQEKVPHGGKKMSSIMVDLLTRGMRTTTLGSFGDCSFYTWSNWCQQSGGPYLHVNRTTTMPSELSEAGYHTNPKQAQLFMNYFWKKLEATTFYWSILKFHGIERPAEGIVTGIISDIDSRIPINGAVVSINGRVDTTDTYESVFHNYSHDPNQLHNGFYYFDGLPIEPMKLIVSAENYNADTVQVTPSDTFFTFVDVQLISQVPPRVVSTTPAAGDTNVTAWNDIVIEFSRRMDAASVVHNLTVSPETQFQYIWQQNSTKLIMRTDTLQYLTTYTINISADAQDNWGHFFDGNGDSVAGDDFSFSFKTGSSDREPPKIVSSYPPINATEVENFPIINITFDEKIDTSTVTANSFKIKNTATAIFEKVTPFHYLVNDQSVICYVPQQPLQNGVKYIGRVFPGITDVFGNRMPRYKSLVFTVTSRQYETSSIEPFESDITANWWDPSSSGSTTGIQPDTTFRFVSHEIVNPLTQSTSSLGLSYGWNESASDWLIRIYLSGGAPKNIHFDKNHILEMYIFGDGSGNKFRFCVDDKVPQTAAANHEVSPWYTIDWLGWKLVKWDMSTDSTGTWLGDGNLDGTLRFDSIQLSHQPGTAEIGLLYFDDLQIKSPLPTSVAQEENPEQIRGFFLGQNYPNPFNNATAIPYQLSEKANSVSLLIFNSLGQKVASFSDLNAEPGNYLLHWQTDNNASQPLSSGLYYYELHVDDQTQSRRMIYLK
ncbi:MAG: T9SS type A sorting domain-containing protein [Calditrichaeota bacterium]|nr:T9SS type A sorting domain-containing protein [Calditrichota bacterium]